MAKNQDAGYIHSFPSVRGMQGGEPFYISMCPARVIPKIFSFDEDEVPPQLRAQRTLNRARIPEIANYLIEAGGKRVRPAVALLVFRACGGSDPRDVVDLSVALELIHSATLLHDDIIEVLLDARALLKDAEPWIRGRLLGTNKNSFEILTDDGRYHHVARDVIVELILVAHLRPPYIDDRELLEFEREDAKRRNRIHEEVDKGGEGGRDDSHVWG